MVLRWTTVGYSVKNVGDVLHTFYLWAYLYDEQNPERKVGFARGPLILATGQEFSWSDFKLVDMVPGHTYRAVAAVYSDSAFSNKLSDDHSPNTVSV